MSSMKKCIFNVNWTYEEKLSWAKSVEGDASSAYCKVCNAKIALSNMGKGALKSHMLSKRHIDFSNAKQSHAPLFKKNVLSSTDNNSATEATISSAANENLTSFETSLSTTQTELIAASQKSKSIGIENYMAKDEVTKAEIIWCLKSIMNHNSLRDIESSVSVIKTVFHDSAIAKQLKLSKDKASYIITYGLSNYFHNEVLKHLESADLISVFFDESLNKICEKQQTDFIVRYWCTEKKEVQVRYFASSFLGHTTALDLLTAFKDKFPPDIRSKIIQISMDGPNVNIKFLRDLKEDMAEDTERKALLDLGSCGLHSMNNAFKKGITATHWEIISFLRALYNLFKNVPARRADYLNISGSSKFPKKFCSVRWLENGVVAERAYQCLPLVKKYVEKVKKDKREPRCSSFEIVSNMVKDEFLGLKLLFFQTMSNEIQPFLTKFQSNDPLAPFLFSEISLIVKSMLTRFIKPDVLENTQLTKIDFLNEKNQLTAKQINIGYATNSALRQLKNVKDLEKLQFKEQCRQCMINFVSKIMERSPIRYPVVKSISCLNPEIAIQKNIANMRISRLLEIFVDSKIISGTTADKIDKEYKDLCEKPIVIEKLRKFDRFKDRLDHFWVNIIDKCGSTNYDNLLYLVKYACVLYHGNAAVERGFSVNKRCLVENQKPKSLVAQRIIYDSVNACGGIENVAITKKMIHAVRNAPSLYKEALAREKHDNQELKAKNESKKRVAAQLKELEVKKRKVLNDAMKETTMIDDQINVLKQV